MAVIVKLIELPLFLFFVFTTFAAPLLDSQNVLPLNFYPKQLLNLNARWASEFDDYLVSETNLNFFVGVIWNELLVLWPLAIANLIAMIYRKSWFNTTCLIFGANCFGLTAALLGELVCSGRGTAKLLGVYYVFMGLSALAVIRGLIPASCSNSRHVSEKKKKMG